MSQCRHPISGHKDFADQVPTPPSKLETVAELQRESPEFTLRTQTVKKLAELLEQERVVHDRGIPSSGKALGQFLYPYPKSRGETFFLIWKWLTDRNPLDQAMETFSRRQRNEANLLRLQVVVILDEAQYTCLRRTVSTPNFQIITHYQH